MDPKFIKTPFPDNHDGFDYAPYSEADNLADAQKLVHEAESSKKQNKMMSMLASVFK